MSLNLLPVGGAGPASSREERHFRALAAAIAEIMFVTTADGRAVEMPRWQELTGQSTDEIAEFGWLNALHPDDVAHTNATWQLSLGTGAPFRADYRIRAKDGTYRWYQARAAAVRDAAGRIEEWIGVCIDIEERRQAEHELVRQAEALRLSEERFRSLVEGVAAIVWTTSPEGTITTEQPGWSAFTGEDFSTYGGGGWIEAVHPDDRDATMSVWLEAVRSGEPYLVEHRLRRADGAYVPMVARGIPIRVHATNEVREWIGFHTDVSRLRRAEDELRTLTAELERRVEQRTSELNEAHRALKDAHDNLERVVEARTAALVAANEEVQRFAYIVSHDLRAPLVNVMGFANELGVLRDELGAMLRGISAESKAALGDEPDRLAAEITESLDFILQSTAKMDRLIGAILRLSREGRRSFTAEPIDLNVLLSSIAASVAHQCQERGAAIEVAPDLPQLHADRLAIEQILTNLIENAVKYLEPGRPGRIRIDATAEAEAEIAIRIADNGRGIAPNDLERVFELFRRAGRQDQPGDGIGLAFVRTQVRRLGGRIECSSVEGTGTTFIVTLPRVAALRDG